VTIKVLVVHADPASTRNLRIRERMKPTVLDRSHTILKPGESTELHVHDLNEIVVEEEPEAPAVVVNGPAAEPPA
jgi:hypothetical protein